MADKKPPFRIFEGTNQNLALSTTHAVTSNALSADATAIRVATNVDVYISVGSAPTATTTDILLPAGTIDYLLVEPSDKVSGEAVAGTGVMSVTECSR